VQPWRRYTKQVPWERRLLISLENGGSNTKMAFGNDDLN